MDTIERALTQMAESIQSDSNWIVETQMRQGREHDERLAHAEQMLRRLLNMVLEQRQRFSVYRRDEIGEKEKTVVRGPGAQRERLPGTNSQQAAER